MIKRVTIVGNKINSDTFEVGQLLVMKQEPDNSFDEQAILVADLDGNQLGYVANNPNTVYPGTMSATVVNSELFSKYTKLAVRIEKEVKVRTSNNGKMVGFMGIIEGGQDNIDKGDDKDMSEDNKVYKLKVIGPEKTAIAKKEVRAELEEGKKPIVTLTQSGDGVAVTFKNLPAGTVSKKANSSEGFYSASDIKDLIPIEGALATAVYLDNANYVIEFRLSEKQIEQNLSIRNLTDYIEYIVEEGIDTEENLNAKLEYLKKCRVEEQTVLKILQSYVKYPEKVEQRVPLKPKTLYQDDKNFLVRKSISYMIINRNLLFEGDRGVGKNVLTETLAWVFKRPLYEYSLNSQQDNTALLGGKVFGEATEEPKQESLSFAKNFMELAKKGFGVRAKDGDEELFSNVFKKFVGYFSGKKLTFEKSVIVEACEYGGILVFDEFNTSLGHIMSLFNSLLDDRRRISIPGYKTIEAHENFLAIATQNKDYVGTFENNEATIDRFVPIMFPTMESIEEILYAKVPTVKATTVATCQSIFEGLKSAIVSGDIDEKALTIRGFIDACTVHEKSGLPLKEALEDNIANRVSDDYEREAIRQMISLEIV